MARQKNDGRGRLGGRQKGTPNKSTSSLREIISEHWQHYQDSGQFKKDLDALDPQTACSGYGAVCTIHSTKNEIGRYGGYGKGYAYH